MKKYDVIIIGGGPGGSVAGTVLSQAGLKVCIIEKEVHPRFHIGESLLPASMPLLKKIGFYDTLNNGRYLQKNGALFVDCQTNEEFYFGFDDGMNPDIPLAFEVERCHFDKDILEHAKKSGADVYSPEKVEDVRMLEDTVFVATDKDEYKAEYLLDISGRDSVIGKKLNIRNVNTGLNNVGVFTHYTGVKRRPGKYEGDITIGLLPNGAWFWVIPFKEGVTSVGTVCSSAEFDGHGDLMGYLNRKIKVGKHIADVMENATPIMAPQMIGNYSHTCDYFFGDRWMLAGDAALFLDPIFSSGVHMSMSSSMRAAETIISAWPNKDSLKRSDLGPAYETYFRLGAKRFRNLIGMFYEGHFVAKMNKAGVRPNARKGYTSAVAGDVWNNDNTIFQLSYL